MPRHEPFVADIHRIAIGKGLSFAQQIARYIVQNAALRCGIGRIGYVHEVMTEERQQPSSHRGVSPIHPPELKPHPSIKGKLTKFSSGNRPLRGVRERFGLNKGLSRVPTHPYGLRRRHKGGRGDRRSQRLAQPVNAILNILNRSNHNM
ncbi:MAG: hypothetical protein WBA51_10300 [Erythrobacter sp.]